MKRSVRTPGDPAEPPAGMSLQAEATVEAPSHLPDESEIDATKIDKAVLTKQGWVCPADLPKRKAE